jgi:hypothetical protein
VCEDKLLLADNKPLSVCAVVVLGNAKCGISENVHYISKLLYSKMKKKKLSSLGK